MHKIGMLMTIDGTNDDLIRIDGVEKYTFTDADAGDLPANEASDNDAMRRRSTTTGARYQDRVLRRCLRTVS